jgi:hypothetical protein
VKRTQKEVAIWKTKMARIAKQVKDMTEEEKKAFVGRNLIVTAEGHQLSLKNTCMLLAQCKGFTPTQIGGFRQWQKIGRTVRKGEHSCGCIMVPVVGKKDEKTGLPEYVRFRFVGVFDVSQTDEMSQENAA